LAQDIVFVALPCCRHVTVVAVCTLRGATLEVVPAQERRFSAEQEGWLTMLSRLSWLIVPLRAMV
jgi:hypothetical protein